MSGAEVPRVKRSVTCIIVENDPIQLLAIKAAMEAVLAGDFVARFRTARDLEECLRRLRSLEFTLPDLVLADLYVSEHPGASEAVEKVAKRILGERIPLLVSLREALGPRPVLIAISRYISFFEDEYKRLGHIEKAQEIETLITQALWERAGVDLIISKFQDKEKYYAIPNLLQGRGKHEEPI